MIIIVNLYASNKEDTLQTKKPEDIYCDPRDEYEEPNGRKNWTYFEENISGNGKEFRVCRKLALTHSGAILNIQRRKNPLKLHSSPTKRIAAHPHCKGRYVSTMRT